MSLTVFSSERFADHLTPVGHPERPERAEVMHRVVADGSVAATLRRQGLERSVQFTWDQTAQKTVEVFRRLVQGAPDREARQQIGASGR